MMIVFDIDDTLPSTADMRAFRLCRRSQDVPPVIEAIASLTGPAARLDRRSAA